MRKLSLVLTGLALLLSGTVVSAQSAVSLRLFPPETTKFPVVSTWLDVHDPAGAFIHDLRPADVTLLENGNAVTVQDLSEIRPAMRIGVVINAAPPMAVHNPEGRTRFELVTETLQTWASRTPHNTGDEYSLFSNTGDPATGLPNASGWLDAFNQLQIDFQTALPSLDSFSTALDSMAADRSSSTAAPQGERVILWITSPPEGKQLAALSGLGDRIRQSGVRLFVWSVSTSAAFGSEGSKLLEQLAYDSGGDFFAFSGVEIIPDPDTYFAPFRSLYALTFTSAAAQSGERTLEAVVQTPDGVQKSTPQTYSIEVLPPNPVLISPPSRIQRAGPAGSVDPLAALEPAQQEIRALFEFPDRHPRALAATRLYVDGKMVVENSREPFDHFTWDLSGITTSGVHRIQVEAQDGLGLSKQSLEIPIEVRVSAPPAGRMGGLLQNTRWMNWVAIGLAGAALGLVIFLSGRSGWFKKGSGKQRTRRGASPKSRLVPPAPGSVDVDPAGAGRTDRPNWPLRKLHPGGAAQFIFLDEDGEPSPRDPLPISGREITFGREPTEVTCVLHDLSVDALHARLCQDETGAYVLSDLGSVAGTWINYALVTGEGSRLEHGDIVHIGRESFRFVLLKPASIPQPRIETCAETL